MPDDPKLTTIRRADAELILSPEVGGSVVSFRMSDVDILRPGSRDAVAEGNPLGLAAFPLFPFSGRIANGQFRHGSQDIVLRPNFPPEPHAIHGQAWQNAWRLAQRTEDTATLVYDHEADVEADDWRWRYRAEQRFVLTEHGVAVSLSLCNLASTPMPAGLGWHPYFPKNGAQLSADVTKIWRSGDDMIPERPAPLDRTSDLRSPRVVSKLDLDNDFSIAGGASRISWPSRGVRATIAASAELRHLVVYTPPREDYFCVEPTSHAPDAVNSELPAELTGYRKLRPGATLSATIELSVEIQ
jgi:aldose 1-epimerase